MQESVLSDFPEADISVSFVWIQMPGFNDNERTAAKIAGTITDPRVRHFYDPRPGHRAGNAFAEVVLKEGAKPAWDIYMFFKKGDEWTNEPPAPIEWMHQLSGGLRGDPARFKTGQDLVDELHATMHKITDSGDDKPLP